MKLLIALFGLSVAVMSVMIFQAARQEFHLRSIKTRTEENTAEVKMKEEAIIALKTKIKQLKEAVASTSAKVEGLRKKKVDTEKSTKDLDKSILTCNKDKADFEKKKTAKQTAITEFKADHKALKSRAEEDIKSLKQQILDRDKAICAFADTTKKEARKLCGLPATQK